MNVFRHKRAWLWIALAIAAIAIVTLLLPHTPNTADQQTWLALLPVFFLGLIAPLGIPQLLPVLTVGHQPQPPALASSFQRPPPSPLA